MSVFLRKQNLKKDVYLSFIEVFTILIQRTHQKPVLMELIYILKLIERMINYYPNKI